MGVLAFANLARSNLIGEYKMFKYLIIIVILTYFIDNGVLALWLYATYLFFLIIGTMSEVKDEFIDWDYPQNRLKSAGKYSFLFDWKNRKQKDVIMPIELIVASQLLFWQIIIYTVIFWTVGIIFPHSEGDIFLSYSTIAVTIELFFFGKGYRIAFVAKYKRFTKANWKYQFWRPLKKSEPEPVKIANGKVVDIQKVRKKTYVSVCKQESQELITKVLFCKEESCQIGKTYSIYEICNVKYIP